MSWRAFMEDLGSTAMDRGYMPPNMNNIEELAAQLSSSDADDVSPLAVGTGVRVKGLRSRPDLNGKTGRVVRAFDGSTGRCGILIEGELKPKALRPDNVELVTTAPFGSPAKTNKKVVQELTCFALRREFQERE